MCRQPSQGHLKLGNDFVANCSMIKQGLLTYVSLIHVMKQSPSWEVSNSPGTWEILAFYRPPPRLITMLKTDTFLLSWGWQIQSTSSHPISTTSILIHTKYRLRLQLTTPHKDTTSLTSYGFVPLLLQCRTPYVAVHTLVLLMMGMMMPKTCWDQSFIINIGLVASCWFLSLHPMFMMHGHTSLRWTIDLHSTVALQSHCRFNGPSSKARNPHMEWVCPSRITINWLLVWSDKYHLSLPTTTPSCIWMDAWVDYSTTSSE